MIDRPWTVGRPLMMSLRTAVTRPLQSFPRERGKGYGSTALGCCGDHFRGIADGGRQRLGPGGARAADTKGGVESVAGPVESTIRTEAASWAVHDPSGVARPAPRPILTAMRVFVRTASCQAAVRCPGRP
jgi:hypothetical protein